MRAMTGYKPVKYRKFKTALFLALLLTISFLAGAFAERTSSVLHEITAIIPAAVEGAKEFLRDQVIFRINTAEEQLKWAMVISLLILFDAPASFIRGP